MYSVDVFSGVYVSSFYTIDYTVLLFVLCINSNPLLPSHAANRRLPRRAC